MKIMININNNNSNYNNNSNNRQDIKCQPITIIFLKGLRQEDNNRLILKTNNKNLETHIFYNK
jgi:hypothetical protein